MKHVLPIGVAVGLAASCALACPGRGPSSLQQQFPQLQAQQVPQAAVLASDAVRAPQSGHWEWQGNGHVWVEDARVSRGPAGSRR